jgi:hypothetical protein
LLPQVFMAETGQAVLQQTLPTQCMLVQSPSPVQLWPSGLVAHLLLLQKPVAQSAAARQPWPTAQVLPSPSQVVPPQSTSVSIPF